MGEKGPMSEGQGRWRTPSRRPDWQCLIPPSLIHLPPLSCSHLTTVQRYLAESKRFLRHQTHHLSHGEWSPSGGYTITFSMSAPW